MKLHKLILVFTVFGLAVLNSGCATSRPGTAKVHPVSLADVQALAKAGMSDDVIISQISSSGTVYHLNAADIIALHNAGVSNRVIQYMITTGPAVASTAAVTATVAAPAPAPAYYYPYYQPAYPWWWWPPVSIGFRFR